MDVSASVFDSISTDANSEQHSIDSTQLGLAALLGVRIDRIVVGVRLGLASPLTDETVSDCCYTAENYPEATTSIFTADVGLSVAVDIVDGVWGSGWVGASTTWVDSDSPAQSISNISFTGQIPAASMSNTSTHLGFGAAIGYDFLHSTYGRGGVYLAFERQDIGPLPVRYSGGYLSGNSDTNAMSYELGLSYAY
ncbi:MAG: hypothetical protein QM831_36810 [Kofleriaceae bacterium]